MTWINHPALRDLYNLPWGESQRIASQRMGELGDLMGQFHVLEIHGERFLIEAYRHHMDPIHNPLGIVARLPSRPRQETPVPARRRRRVKPTIADHQTP